MFVPEYSYTVTEHDPARPWIVRGNQRRTITLDDGVSFFEWAHRQCPGTRWSVELDPWQLARGGSGSTKPSNMPDAGPPAQP